MFVVSFSDSMSFDEFVDVCRKEPATSEDDLMKAFRKIDINGDGYISLDELYKIMTTVNRTFSSSLFAKFRVWFKCNWLKLRGIGFKFNLHQYIIICNSHFYWKAY